MKIKDYFILKRNTANADFTDILVKSETQILRLRDAKSCVSTAIFVLISRNS
jgi:glutaredoxin 2